MATPYEIVARELRTRLPTAQLTPSATGPQHLYHSAPPVDYSRLHQPTTPCT